MSRETSLRRRLITWVAGANTLVLVVAASLYLWRSYGLQSFEMTDIIHHLAEQAAVSAERHPGGLVLSSAILEEERKAKARGLAVIDQVNGKAASGSDPYLVERVGPLIAQGLEQATLTFDDGAGGVLVVVVETVATPDGSRTAIVSFIDQSKWEWLGHELMSDVVPIFVPLLIATLLITSIIVRRGLAPVAALSQRAAQLAPTTLDVRLGLAGVPSEISPLIAAFNAALDRVAAGFDSQRRFTANAAHELRTPLAVLKARSESIGEGALKDAINADIDRMAHLVDQLLAMARLEAREIHTDEDVDLAELARLAISRIFPLAHSCERDIAFEHDGVPALILGNISSLYDALRNVMENAIRVAPRGSTVEVRLEHGRALSVLDHGPGVELSEREAIFQPFRRSSGGAGGSAGLGLAIAAEAARLHGGTLSITDRPGGGACFTFDFGSVRPAA